MKKKNFNQFSFFYFLLLYYKMAGRRTYKGNRRSNRRRYMRKKRLGLPISVWARKQILATKCFVNFADIATGSDTITSGFGARTFNLSQLSQAFGGLFDRYKIAGVKWRYVLNRTPDFATTGLTTRGYNVIVNSVYDYDDDTAPTQLETLYQYPMMKEDILTQDRPYGKWRFFKPARTNVGFESVTNSSYEPVWKGFVDVNSNTTPYYGIKYGYRGLYLGINISLEAYVYVIMKNIR